MTGDTYRLLGAVATLRRCPGRLDTPGLFKEEKGGATGALAVVGGRHNNLVSCAGRPDAAGDALQATARRWSQQGLPPLRPKPSLALHAAAPY